MALCEPCATEYDKWCNARPGPMSTRLVSVGVNSARAVIEARHLHAEGHYRLVRQQLRLITTNCIHNHGAAS